MDDAGPQGDVSAIRPRLSVIIATAGDAVYLPMAFAALAHSRLARDAWELVVVADTKRDAAFLRGAHYADVIVRLNGSWAHGPAYRRNRAAEVARGDVLVFLDRDVVVQPETLRRIDEAFSRDANLVALVGTVEVPERDIGYLTRYVTLRQDWMQRRRAGTAGYFSTRCGAVRADMFFRAGRLDEWRVRRGQWAAGDLGLRLRALGCRVELHDQVRVWGRGRARLGDAVTSPDLGPLRPREIAAALMAWSSVASIVAGASMRWGAPVVIGATGLTLVAASNLSLCRYIARRGGVALAFLAPPVGLLEALLVGATAAGIAARNRLVGERRPAPGVEALAEVGVDLWPPLPAPSRMNAQVSMADERRDG